MLDYRMYTELRECITRVEIFICSEMSVLSGFYLFRVYNTKYERP